MPAANAQDRAKLPEDSAKVNEQVHARDRPAASRRGVGLLAEMRK
jgi:hypothetical protein